MIQGLLEKLAAYASLYDFVYLFSHGWPPKVQCKAFIGAFGALMAALCRLVV
jgi:hypothetical protein